MVWVEFMCFLDPQRAARPLVSPLSNLLRPALCPPFHRPRHPLMALADQDESVRIAVRALGDMRNSTHHTTSPATCTCSVCAFPVPTPTDSY